MKINFIWSGLDLGDEEKVEAQSAITEAITGAVIDRSGKQVIKITRSNFAGNHTEYEQTPSE